jgi:hypothetical protein
MGNLKLCEWLRNNSSGIYRPAAEAATKIEIMEMALFKIAAIDDNLEGGDWDEIEEARQIANRALSLVNGY